MSRKEDPDLVTPEEMSGMMKALYPLKAGKNAFPRFRYDFILRSPRPLYDEEP